jgi:hypothetical protein
MMGSLHLNDPPLPAKISRKLKKRYESKLTLERPHKDRKW